MLGVIAAGNFQTAQAGAEILQQGGNAVDAAVAATFASFVAEPALVNIGGGGIAQVYDPVQGQSTVFDFFSTMPGLPAPKLELGSNLDFHKIMIDFGAAQQAFYIGRASVAVPGVVAGLSNMLATMGRLSLAQVLTPAIRMAREGIVMTDMQAYCASLLEHILTDTPQIKAIYSPTGHFTTAGQSLYNKALAVTLEQLGQEGPSLFYKGHVAEKIVSDQQKHGGLLTAMDLNTYQVSHSKPIEVSYRGYTVLLPADSSSGGPLISFALKLLASIPLATLPHNGVDHIRTLAEVMRLTNIARAEWRSQRAAATATNKTMADVLLADDNIYAYQQQLEQILAGQTAPTEPILPQGPSNTSHLNVGDANGMMVSITTSAGECAGYAVADTGLVLNNMLGESDLHPNGFHKLPPGQRLRTMMSPVLVLYRGRPVLSIGSGGSNRLRTAILQVISNLVDYEIPVQAAVDASRIHFEDNVLQLEGGIEPAVAQQLEQVGYTVNLWAERNMFFGGAHTIAANVGDWTAAGDSRRGGAVRIVA